jgi:hypothetical protein
MARVDCSLTMNYLNEKTRMCECYYKDNCRKCGLNAESNKVGIGCSAFCGIYPEKAIVEVQKWSDEHPRKTYAEDFFEKFPKAKKNEYGFPCIFWCGVHNGNICDKKSHTCNDCWKEYMEVSK